jgi:hypothetical protein
MGQATRSLYLVVIALVTVAVVPVSQAEENSAAALRLWYTKTAANWETEALPIGNGRLGAMIFGGVPREHVQFNESSLWSARAAEGRASGSVWGLCTRGGITVDIQWKDGKVTSYRIVADRPRSVNVRINGDIRSVKAAPR